MLIEISIHALREEGDTDWLLGLSDDPRFLSTPSARRATRSASPAPVWQTISIHALREEGDVMQFAALPGAGISIHALREEGDYIGLEIKRPFLDFYPRPPRGGRRRMPPSASRTSSISIHALREEGD